MPQLQTDVHAVAHARGRLSASLCGLVVLLLHCEPLLLYEDHFPQWKAPADKALLVVARPQKLYAGISALLYHERRYIGALQGGDVTSFEIEPGEHLIVAKAASRGRAKLHFRAGKVYYLIMAVFPIPSPRTQNLAVSLSPQPGEEADEFYAERKGRLKYVRPNPNARVDDMDEDDWKQEIEDYRQWAEDKPADAGRESQYPGY